MSNELANTRPSYLTEQTFEDYSKQQMMEYAKPSFIKIIQAMAGPPYKPPFTDGDIVVAPQNVKIGDANTPFTFIPLYFFPTFVCWNPLEMKGQLPAFREFSFDPNSSTAQKARKFVVEPCPEAPKYEIKYAQMLNFIVLLEDHPDFNSIPVATFFTRGEFKTGQLLISLIQSRKAPSYACRFRAGSELHSGPKGRWFGLNIQSDPKQWVSDEKFPVYAELHKQYHELVQSRALVIDVEQEDGAAESAEY